MITKRRFLVLLLITLTFVSLVSISFFIKKEVPSNSQNLHIVRLVSVDKTVDLEVAYARTSEEQMKGLMNREKLEGIDGMLFIFPFSEYQSFWMKDTLIPLDIIYFDSDKKFVSAQLNAQPCLNRQDCPTYPSQGKIKYVLETPAGLVNKDFLQKDLTIEFKE